MRAFGLIVVVGSALAIAACGLDVTGTQNDIVGGDGDSGSTVDGGILNVDGAVSFDATGGDGAGGGDAGSADAGSADAPSYDSAPPPTDGGCAPSPEQCFDGVDNDCNGLTDCADPACTTKATCEPSIAAGWTLVAFNPSATPACPAGYANAVDSYSLTGPASPFTCTCSCALGDMPSCTTGGSVNLYADPQLPGQPSCPILPMPWTISNGTCVQNPNVPSSPGAGARVTPLGLSGGTCKPTQTMTPPPAPPALHGRVCTSQKTGGGCASGGVCAGPAAGGFAICVQQSGDVACPAGYPTKTLVGVSVSDTRACGGSCTCGSPTATCANARLAFFDKNDCTGHELDLKADDQCDTVMDMANQNYSSHKYMADVTNPACGNPTGNYAPTGSVTLQSPRTVCCP